MRDTRVLDSVAKVQLANCSSTKPLVCGVRMHTEQQSRKRCNSSFSSKIKKGQAHKSRATNCRDLALAANEGIMEDHVYPFSFLVQRCTQQRVGNSF